MGDLIGHDYLNGRKHWCIFKYFWSVNKLKTYDMKLPQELRSCAESPILDHTDGLMSPSKAKDSTEKSIQTNGKI